MSSLPPHVFGVSEMAFNAMSKTGKNQSMIVCGESGSGKTESAKQLMRYLAYTTTKDPSSLGTTSKHRRNKSNLDGVVSIEQQVLDANPILESFGNAKTNLNNNSSRFGKFTKILFDDADTVSGHEIAGSFIETYLLEQSRIIGEFDAGERNFHIFYQICSTGLDAALRAKFALTSPQDFTYLNGSTCMTVAGIDDASDNTVMEYALDGLKVSRDDQVDMYGVLASVLHIGNVTFDNDGSEGVKISAKAEQAVQRAASILGVDYDALEKRLISRTIVVMGKGIVKPLSMSDASDNRDSITKTLYQLLFDWIVCKINDELFDTNQVRVVLFPLCASPLFVTHARQRISNVNVHPFNLSS
jgi:myosin-5